MRQTKFSLASRTPWGLTAREEQVMDTMLVLYNRKLTAKALGVELSTINEHLRHVMWKMKSSSQLGAYLRYQKFKLTGEHS